MRELYYGHNNSLLSGVFARECAKHAGPSRMTEKCMMLTLKRGRGQGQEFLIFVPSAMRVCYDHE
ncbi:protein of unknown function [Acidithiobacillus ferrivorans]|uniref:Uncharacterized protein n=1 Tax=Acidithiobacillus ferrivorans TaxID=160808 RepID=A0A060UU64_9PROT|nr:hypothetical protein AFERRI_400114 [Acidithiobacillus ferrivorans]SMH64359.1 protein of unknown function [Acidithiobacillus ferrivorans]